MSNLARSVLPVLLLVCSAASLEAQPLCRGDVDGDGFVTSADIEPLLEVVFDVDGFDAASLEVADLNQDGDVSAADVVAVLLLEGLQCPGGGATRTRTPTRTPTRTSAVGLTPTPTPSRPPTTTPTVPCLSAPLSTGTTAGTLATTDCEVEFNRELRFTDAYTFIGAPGQGLRVAITGSGFTPYVRVVDPNGWFGVEEGRSPVEIRLTSGQPYTILVSSAPDSGSQVGTYQIDVSTRACTSQPLTTTIATFDGTECPDPSFPSFGGPSEFADVYTFTVAETLTLISITMRQSREDSLVDPMIAVYGPDGFEVFPSFQADDQASSGFGFDAAARFLALDTGTYTVVATSGGCDPEDEFGCGYRIQFSSTKCSATAVQSIPDTVRVSLEGTLWGDPVRTRCAAPLPLAGGDDDGIPEVGSPADLYTFQGSAGEVITVEMESEDEGQLYLLGPASAGMRLIGADGDDSGNLLAQIGVVLPFTGTYTIVAANKNYLFPPDPEDPEDEGEFIEYTLFLQKCPVRGALNVAGGTVRSDSFSAVDCIASGDVPVRSYAVSLTAGTYLDTTMRSAVFDSSLTLVSPDGSRVTNDDDPLTAGSRHSRLSRIVPITGTYFIEASAPPDETVSAGAFELRARTCATAPAAAGLVVGTLVEDDCALEDGRRFDVRTFDAPPDAGTNPSVASILPGDGVCVWPVLPVSGSQPELGCAPAPVDVPIATTGRYAWVVVGGTAPTRGPYSLDFTRCAAEEVGFGAALSGFLQATDCSDAAGRPTEWFVLRDSAALTRFGRGASGAMSTTFASRFSIAGADGAQQFASQFAVDVEAFYMFADQLLTVLKLQGETAGDLGGYDLEIDVPDRRQ